MRGFDHIETWVFDLDNTLYPASCRLFDQIDEKIGAFVAARLNVDTIEAHRLQKSFYREYGTTLRGLMEKHQVEPLEFLEFVHDIDHSPVVPDAYLDDVLHRLPGRKLVFTNGSVRHAEKVLDRIGITHHFGDIFDIVHAEYIPKPAIEPYRKFIARTGITPERSAMFEDIARNLEAPHVLGMTTVLVTSPDNGAAGELGTEPAAEAAHVHHVTDNLPVFLARLADTLSIH
jgi:putative hydrolase of the HAD superfamily